jgi:hypothetical protein
MTAQQFLDWLVNNHNCETTLSKVVTSQVFLLKFVAEIQVAITIFLAPLDTYKCLLMT